MELSKEEIRLLQSKGWEIESRNPFKAVRYAGRTQRLDSEAGAVEEIKHIRQVALLNQFLKKDSKKKFKKPATFKEAIEILELVAKNGNNNKIIAKATDFLRRL